MGDWMVRVALHLLDNPVFYEDAEPAPDAMAARGCKRAGSDDSRTVIEDGFPRGRAFYHMSD